MRVVYKNVVQSRNFIDDFLMSIKNIIGGRLNKYELMLNDGIEEAIKGLVKDYPDVKDIKLQITEFKNASICITVYGVLND